MLDFQVCKVIRSSNGHGVLLSAFKHRLSFAISWPLGVDGQRSPYRYCARLPFAPQLAQELRDATLNRRRVRDDEPTADERDLRIGV